MDVVDLITWIVIAGVIIVLIVAFAKMAYKAAKM
jgi:hypothetical protein